MQPIIMQDWITIRGTSAAPATVIQSQVDWLNTAPFQDITFFLDVREFTGATTPTIVYETAPGRDEQLFIAMAPAVAVAVGAAASKNIYAANANVPVSNWTRWKLTGANNPWDVTFRIMATGNSIC